jgi:hypothetical protein
MKKSGKTYAKADASLAHKRAKCFKSLELDSILACGSIFRMTQRD